MIKKANVQCRTRNIEYRSVEAQQREQSLWRLDLSVPTSFVENPSILKLCGCPMATILFFSHLWATITSKFM